MLRIAAQDRICWSSEQRGQMTMTIFLAAVDAAGRSLYDTADEVLFPWWSVTKTAIAALMLCDAERGRVDLDAPLPGRPFTLRQLLQHRAGLGDYGSLPAYQMAVAADEDPWPVDELMRRAGARTLRYMSGTRWAYSNIGYLLLRQVLEQTHNAPLAALLQQEICQPLGLSARLAETRADFAALAWPAARRYHPGWVYHGCLIGTAREAALMMQAVLEGEILSPDMRALMRAPAMQAPAVPGRPWSAIGYGMGLMLGEAPGLGAAIGHAGGGPFAANYVGSFPEGAPGVTVAAFGAGPDSAPAEEAAIALARELAAPPR